MKSLCQILLPIVRTLHLLWRVTVRAFYRTPNTQVMMMTVVCLAVIAIFIELEFALPGRIALISQLISILFDKAESIAVLTAAVIFLKDAPSRI